MSALSPVASPSRYQYRCTASHHKTLSVLGKVKNFAKLSVEELSGYCGLMKSENGCQSSAHAADALASRFGWATVSRLADIETAWKSLNFSSDDAEVDQEEYGGEELKTSSDPTKVVKEDKIIPPDKLSEPAISASRIPIVIRNNSWERKILLCEVDDQEFNISGDSGAVGRISVDPTSIMVDVKGASFAMFL